MNMYLSATKKIIILFLLLPVIGLHIPFSNIAGCSMTSANKKMACCVAKTSVSVPGQNISAKCCCEYSKGDRSALPGVYVIAQNEISQTVEKNYSIETGNFSFNQDPDSFHLSKFELLFQKNPKPEIKIYTLISSYLI